MVGPWLGRPAPILPGRGRRDPRTPGEPSRRGRKSRPTTLIYLFMEGRAGAGMSTERRRRSLANSGPYLNSSAAAFDAMNQNASGPGVSRTSARSQVSRGPRGGGGGGGPGRVACDRDAESRRAPGPGPGCRPQSRPGPGFRARPPPPPPSRPPSLRGFFVHTICRSSRSGDRAARGGAPAGPCRSSPGFPSLGPSSGRGISVLAWLRSHSIYDPRKWWSGRVSALSIPRPVRTWHHRRRFPASRTRPAGARQDDW